VVALLAGAGVALTALPAQAHTATAATAVAEAPVPSSKPTPTSSTYGMWDPHVRPVVQEVAARFGVSTVITRPGHSPTQGRAADFMVHSDRAKGDAIAQYVIDNAARFRVEYVIWKQRIYLVSSASSIGRGPTYCRQVHGTHWCPVQRPRLSCTSRRSSA
jgi:hypothetical protein